MDFILIKGDILQFILAEYVLYIRFGFTIKTLKKIYRYLYCHNCFTSLTNQKI